jgi:uncharacterized protein (TIGR02722 family)
MKSWIISLTALSLISCSSFKAERVDDAKSDEKGMEITDNWLQKDTEMAVTQTIAQIKAHPGYVRYKQKHSEPPAIFVAEIQNITSEAYFPISEINNELLNELSLSGEFVLVDAAARKKLLEEITYQNDGMVDPATIKRVGKQTGADLLIFGSVFMQPEARDGKTLKQYSLDMRVTDLEKGVEVLRTRTKVSKFSQKKKFGF